MLCGQSRRRGSSTSSLGQSQAVLPAWGSAGSPWLCGTTPSRHLMAAPVLLRRTPTWTMSWLLPTSLPKHTECRHAGTGWPSRPSSGMWSCHPLHPRKGSRSPSQRNRQRRHKFLQVRFPGMLLGPAWWWWGFLSLLQMTQDDPDQGGGAPAVPQCRSITPGVPVPPDHRQLTELTQDLVQWRQELVGAEEAQAPLMEPIHFEKVAEPGRWPCSAWGG